MSQKGRWALHAWWWEERPRLYLAWVLPDDDTNRHWRIRGLPPHPPPEAACTVGHLQRRDDWPVLPGVHGKRVPVWEVPDWRHHHAVAGALLQTQPTCEVLPPPILDLLRLPYATEHRPLPRLSEPLEQALMPFQRAAVEFVWSRRGCALLADDMGCGKTFQAMGVLSAFAADRPAVIVCPPAVRVSWEVHLAEYLPHDLVVVIKDTAHLRRVVAHAPHRLPTIFVVSYGLIGQTDGATAAAGWKPRMVVVDEAHQIRNPRACRSRIVGFWCRHAARRLLMTGTPMNRPIELFHQLKCVAPELYPQFAPDLGAYRFRKTPPPLPPSCWDTATPADTRFWYAARYCKPSLQTAKRGGRPVGPPVVFQGSHYEGELHAVLRHTVMVRRRKHSVVTLPPKTRERVVLLRGNAELVRQCRRFEDDDAAVDFRAGSDFMQAVRDTALAKVAFVTQYLREILVPKLLADEQLVVLVWTHHRAMHDACRETLEAALKTPEAVVALDGRSRPAVRKAGLKALQEGPVARAGVLSVAAFGAGVTLTRARESVFAELGFTPGDLTQAEDRIHRVGQTQSTSITYLVCQGSTDDRLWRMLTDKSCQTGRALDGVSHLWHCPAQHVRQEPDGEPPEQAASGEEDVDPDAPVVPTRLVAVSHKRGHSGHSPAPVKKRTFDEFGQDFTQ